MRLGISSYTYNWWATKGLTPELLLKRAGHEKVGVVQIADNLSLTSTSATDLRQLADQLTLEMELGTAGIDHATLSNYLRLAVQCRATVLRTLLDTAEEQPTADQAIGALREFAPHLEKSGVTLAIENHDRLRSAALRGIIDAVGSRNVAVCLDTANSFGCGESVEVVLDHLADVTANLHVKDIRISRLSHKKGFLVEGASAGQGLLDIPAILKRVQRSPYQPNCILELWTLAEERTQDSVAKEDRWAHDSIEYLRRYLPD